MRAIRDLGSSWSFVSSVFTKLPFLGPFYLSSFKGPGKAQEIQQDELKSDEKYPD